MTYKIFRRSAKSFEEMVNARKYTICKAQTIEEARRICKEFNENRNGQQIASGTKYEFISL